MTLSFTAFHLEKDYDYLEIYDGDSENAPMIAELTGDELPSEVTASSGKMFVKMTSDDSERDQGFEASYTVSASSTTTTGSSHQPTSGGV